MNTPIGNYILRRLTVQDNNAFFDLIERNRFYLRDYFPLTTRTITSLELCAAYLHEKQEQALRRENFAHVIEAADGLLIGYISVKDVDWSMLKCELAYFIDEHYAGQGIMPLALCQVIQFCFGIGLNKIVVITAINNHRSRNMLLHAGFIQEGILQKNFILSSGEVVDMVMYGMEKEK